MLAWIYSKYFVYVVVRKLYSVIQGVWWMVNGTYLSLYTSKQDKNYYRSAHLLDIVFRYKLDLVVGPSGPDNFITTHTAFVSPSYVLQDNVSLYYVTATEAIFTESPETIDVSHSDNGPFLRAAQFENARRIIKIPIAAFHRMAEEIGDPTGEIVFLTNTCRCGSTLLTQIFEETGECVGFSEPDAFNAIAIYKDKMPQDDLDKFIRNSIRMQCKPVCNRRISAYIVKLSAPCIEVVPMYLRLYPNSKQLFMYREGLKVAQSFVRASTQLPLGALVLIVAMIHPCLTEMCFEAMGLPAQDFKIKLPSPMTFAVYFWAIICRKYLDLKKNRYEINAVKYEDLVKHPLESTKVIFKYCNLPEELAEKAIKAMSQDSQRHSPLSMKNMAKAKTFQLTGEDKVTTDAICSQMGLPRIPKPCNLDGTITTYKG